MKNDKYCTANSQAPTFTKKCNAIVTGASRGIGRATALALAAAGWGHITICADRDAAGLQETERIILKSSGAAVHGNPEMPGLDVAPGSSEKPKLETTPENTASPDSHHLQAEASGQSKAQGSLSKGLDCQKTCRVLSMLGDISDEAFVQELVKRACEESGAPVDTLVNNAGISIVGLVQDLSYSDWHRILDVNLSSVFLTSRAIIPGMLQEQAGHIINVSSMWGRVGASCESAYSATKGGVIAFTQALAKELAPSGISVNCVAPGCVDTVMNGHLSAEEKAALAEEIPAGRFASPSEIASVILGIACSPAYMTGQPRSEEASYIGDKCKIPAYSSSTWKW